MITQTINLNMTPGVVKPRIWASQNDSGERAFVFNLYDGTDTYSPASTDTVLLNGVKSDDTTFSYTCEVDDYVVTADCTSAMTSLAGDVTCEIRVYDSDSNSVGSANFILSVEVDPQDLANVSENELAALYVLTTQGAAYASAAATSAEEAAASATELSDTVDQVATNTTNIATNASDIADLQSDKIDVANIVNNFTTTTTGTYVLDAAAGATLNDTIDAKTTLMCTLLGSGSDCDDAYPDTYPAVGFYISNTDANARPANYWYFILSFRGEDTYVTQVAFGMTNSTSYYRRFTIGTTDTSWVALSNT